MEYVEHLARCRPDTRGGGRIRGGGRGFAAGARPSVEYPLQTASGFRHRKQAAVFGCQPQYNAAFGAVFAGIYLVGANSNAGFVDVCGGGGGRRGDKRTDYVSVGQYFKVCHPAILGRRLYRNQRPARARGRHQSVEHADDAGRSEPLGRTACGNHRFFPQQPVVEPPRAPRQYFGRLCHPYGRNPRSHPFGFG